MICVWYEDDGQLDATFLLIVTNTIVLTTAQHHLYLSFPQPAKIVKHQLNIVLYTYHTKSSRSALFLLKHAATIWLKIISGTNSSGKL